MVGTTGNVNQLLPLYTPSAVPPPCCEYHMRRRSRQCIRREDKMNVGMILPFSKNAYVGNFRHAPLVAGGATQGLAQPSTSKAARALLPSALRNHPLVGALCHAPPSHGLKTLIADAGHGPRGFASAANMVARVNVSAAAAPMSGSRPSSPLSTASSGGRSSPLSCSSADHEYGGISNWAARMGSVLDNKEGHMETWQPPDASSPGAGLSL